MFCRSLKVSMLRLIWTLHDNLDKIRLMARLAVHETGKNSPREVVRWLDKKLIRFASKFGNYISEDPSSFRLSTNFSLI
ncbi:putative protein transport protein Sec23 [Helianthus debilis subsp. tardiflorus]